MYQNRGNLWINFLQILEVLRCFLGAILALRRLSWKGLWSFFCYFRALDGPLGPILAPSWADLVPKWGPKIAPKVVQKVPKIDSKKMTPKNTRHEPILDPKMGPRISPKSAQDGPRWFKTAQDHPSSPKTIQDSLQAAPRRPKTRPKRPNMGPR